MITKSKIEQRDVRLKTSGRKWSKIAGLVILLIVVAGGTFGLMWALHRTRAEDATKNTETAVEGTRQAHEAETDNATETDDATSVDSATEVGDVASANDGEKAGGDGVTDGGADRYSGEVTPLTGEPMSEAESMMLLGGVMGGYTVDYPGRSLMIVGCARNVADNKIECELVDPMNGNELRVGLVAWHQEWQWLVENVEKYGWTMGSVPWRIVWYNG